MSQNSHLQSQPNLQSNRTSEQNQLLGTKVVLSQAEIEKFYDNFKNGQAFFSDFDEFWKNTISRKFQEPSTFVTEVDPVNRNVKISVKIFENKRIQYRMTFNEIRAFEPTLECVKTLYEKKIDEIESKGESSKDENIKELKQQQEEVIQMIEKAQPIAISDDSNLEKFQGKEQQYKYFHSKRAKSKMTHEDQAAQRNTDYITSTYGNPPENILLTQLQQPTLELVDEWGYHKTKLKEKFFGQLNIMRRNYAEQIDGAFLKNLQGGFMSQSVNSKISPNAFNFALKMPGTYTFFNQRINKQESIDLINFKFCNELKLDSAALKGSNKEKNFNKTLWTLEVGTHLNQLFGRLVFNSVELAVLYFTNSLSTVTETFVQHYIWQQPKMFTLDKLNPGLFDNSFQMINFKRIEKLHAFHYIDKYQIAQIALKYPNDPVAYNKAATEFLSYSSVPYQTKNQPQQTLEQYFTQLFQTCEDEDACAITDTLSIQIVYRKKAKKENYEMYGLEAIEELYKQNPPIDIENIGNDSNYLYEYQYYVLKRLKDLSGNYRYQIQNVYGQCQQVNANANKGCLLKDLVIPLNFQKHVLMVNIYGFVKANPGSPVIQAQYDVVKNLFQVFHDKPNNVESLQVIFDKILKGQQSQPDIVPTCSTFDDDLSNAVHNKRMLLGQTTRQLCHEFKILKTFSDIYNQKNSNELRKIGASFQLKLFQLDRKIQNAINDLTAATSSFLNLYSTKEETPDSALLRKCLSPDDIQGLCDMYQCKLRRYNGFLHHFYQLKKPLIQRLNNVNLSKRDGCTYVNSFINQHQQNYFDDTKSIIRIMNDNPEKNLQKLDNIDDSYLNSEEKKMVDYLKKMSKEMLMKILDYENDRKQNCSYDTEAQNIVDKMASSNDFSQLLESTFKKSEQSQKNATVLDVGSQLSNCSIMFREKRITASQAMQMLVIIEEHQMNQEESEKFSKLKSAVQEELNEQQAANKKKTNKFIKESPKVIVPENDKDIAKIIGNQVAGGEKGGKQILNLYTDLNHVMNTLKPTINQVQSQNTITQTKSKNSKNGSAKKSNNSKSQDVDSNQSQLDNYLKKSIKGDANKIVSTDSTIFNVINSGVENSNLDNQENQSENKSTESQNDTYDDPGDKSTKPKEIRNEDNMDTS